MFVSVSTALEYVKNGQMMIITDREDRENEGDLFISAACIRPEHINFMITFGRGLVCVPISSQHALQLNLKPMIPLAENTEYTQCNFTVPVDATECTGSGISAFDRALTIKKLADPSSTANDFHKPGHVFPLIAHPEGLKKRDGHTEAAVWLAEQAGFDPSGVICEIIDDDGNMCRGEQLVYFAKKYQLPILAIESIMKELN